MKRKAYEHFKSSWKIYVSLVALGALSTKVDASAIERMTTSTGQLSSLVKGPVG